MSTAAPTSTTSPTPLAPPPSRQRETPDVVDVVDVADLIPQGMGTPAHIPADVFAAALATFLQGERLDMQGLAAQLGVSRSTLYRRAGHRSDLLGEIVWYLTRRAIIPALRDSAPLEGADRVCYVIERFMRAVDGHPAFRRLLEAEPEHALRILTSKEGPVQGALIAATERLLLQEEARGALVLGVDSRSLAYTIVRIGEAFLYADVIAQNDLDFDAHCALIRRLLEPTNGSGRPSSVPGRPTH
jgi:AcrR family transcriptional regulator